jgi:thymidylate synthase (FAD)
MSQQVRLIAMTDWKTSMTGSPEGLISYCARVSNPENQENFDTAEKLLRYCIKNEHWSIFEMVHIVMEIKTTRDIGRQILRHRSFSFQEFSQRYAEVTDPFEYREARLQDGKNRQNSIENDDEDLNQQWLAEQQDLIHIIEDKYVWAIKNGIAKEQARALLPEGLTPSTMYMAGSLRSWIHYCDLRRGNGTQKENREIAEMCWNILKENFKFLEGYDENED